MQPNRVEKYLFVSLLITLFPFYGQSFRIEDFSRLPRHSLCIGYPLKIASSASLTIDRLPKVRAQKSDNKVACPAGLDCCDSSFTALKGGFVLRDDGLLPGTFVFASRTQIAADENRRSQKPPAVWICARTFGERSKATGGQAPHFFLRRKKARRRISGGLSCFR